MDAAINPWLQSDSAGSDWIRSSSSDNNTSSIRRNMSSLLILLRILSCRVAMFTKWPLQAPLKFSDVKATANYTDSTLIHVSFSNSMRRSFKDRIGMSMSNWPSTILMLLESFTYRVLDLRISECPKYIALAQRTGSHPSHLQGHPSRYQRQHEQHIHTGTNPYALHQNF